MRGELNLLAVVAHPDDETFGCGSLLLHAAAAGLRTAVLCATRGEAGEVADGASGSLAVRREDETRSAAAILGVDQVDFLDFVDSGMSGPVGPHTLVGAPPDAVSERVRAHLERVRPTVVVTLDGSDGHRDHERIGAATLAAVEAADWPVTAVYLQCQTRSLLRRWVDVMAAGDPSWEHLRLDVPGTPDELVTTVIDTSAHLPVRERAIAAHASQRSPFAGLPAELYRDFLTVERLRRVRPPWEGGSPETDLVSAPRRSG